MALAILDLLDTENGNARFNIDTGTNRYYRLKVGRSVRSSNGIDWVDEVFLSTPMRINENGGDLINSSTAISVPVEHLQKERKPRRSPDGSKVYAQLFSFKTAEGRSPAFSRVVRVSTAPGLLEDAPVHFALPFTASTPMTPASSFRSPRRIPCTSYKEVYARQASFEDLLGGIVKAAAPFVLDLLKGSQNMGSQSSPSGGTTANGTAGQADTLVRLLTTLLGKLSGTGAPASQTQSLMTVRANRFIDQQHNEFSRPFIFGIDDALIAAVAGPIIQVLPQLMNSANQKRVQLKQANNKLITDLVSDINRRMLLEQLLQAQRQPPAPGQPGNGAELNQLIQLLQQAPAAPQQPAGETPPPQTPAPDQPAPPPNAQTQSVAVALSRTAVVSFVAADPITWNGTPRVVYARNQAIQLKVQLVVAEPAPRVPLPKAIVKFTFKDASDQTVLLEKLFKQKNVAANTELSFSFAPDETQRLPANKAINVFAEVRWLSAKTGKEIKAVGSQEIVLAGKFSLKEQGGSVSDERELSDMTRYRAFWNKIWEAPSLGSGSRNGSSKKFLWELNVDAKYSVLLSAAHDANGLMETKLLKGKPDPESLAERTEGRMKGGIELSINELNKLVSLWDGATPLDAERLEALKTEAFVRSSATEFVHHVKLKGKREDRGMVWVIPTFKLFEVTLGAVSRVDDTGQVAEVSEEKARIPLPVAARVIGLKSRQ